MQISPNEIFALQQTLRNDFPCTKLAIHTINVSKPKEFYKLFCSTNLPLFLFRLENNSDDEKIKSNLFEVISMESGCTLKLDVYRIKGRIPVTKQGGVAKEIVTSFYNSFLNNIIDVVTVLQTYTGLVFNINSIVIRFKDNTIYRIDCETELYRGMLDCKLIDILNTFGKSTISEYNNTSSEFYTTFKNIKPETIFIQSICILNDLSFPSLSTAYIDLNVFDFYEFMSNTPFEQIQTYRSLNKTQQV